MKKENYLNEKDSLTDVLTAEKGLMKIYTTLLSEAVGKDVRRAVKNNMTETAEEQFGLFKTMQTAGYYMPKIADKAIIDQKIDSSSKILKELNC